MRLDKELVVRKLVASRERAQDLIIGGNVRVDGHIVSKPSQKVTEAAMIDLIEQDFPWVSRGGLKLEQAINEFNVDVKSMICLDIGACTGGLTDVLFHYGAKKVYALDVGHGQLAEKLKHDARVVNMEGQNIRSVKKNMFGEKIDLVVIDVSFISLEHVLPIAANVLRKNGSLIAQIKPHFEVGKGKTKKGFVLDKKQHKQVIEKIRMLGASLGLQERGLTIAPIAEGKNKEFLIYFQK